MARPHGRRRWGGGHGDGVAAGGAIGLAAVPLVRAAPHLLRRLL
ncbi:hypothetical protein AB0I77_35830 [Streptomyces sp. NPDC050619]